MINGGTIESMKIDDAYSKWAANYDTDRNLTRDLDRDVTERTLASSRFTRIVEAGCGTGKNTPLFARIGGEVLALDFSEGMLAIARQRVTDRNVCFKQANLLKPWPCDTGVAQLVSCNLVLEHVEHLEAIFREAARVLAVGGSFSVSELHPHKQYLGSQARFGDAGHSEIKIDAFTHHLSDFVGAARAAGFQLESVDEAWHDEDVATPPRLIYFMFRKAA